MKKLYMLAVLLLITVGASAQEGKNIYNKYSSAKGVSAVYISPSMFRLIGKLPQMQVEVGDDGQTMDIAPLIKSFSGFYMLDISDKTTADALAADISAMVSGERSKKHYELMMEVKDDGENLRIYTAGDDKTIESFVFHCLSDDDVQFICIDGAMSREEVEALIAKAASVQ